MSFFGAAARISLLVVLLAVAGERWVMGQEADTLVGGERAVVWSRSVVGKLAGSQAGYSNWAKGGVNSIAASAALDGKFGRRSSVWQQKHDFRLGFGLVKQDTLEFRKADDEIVLTSSVQYLGDGFFKYFNPTIALQTRTQFAPGFNYKRNPFEDGLEPPVKVSDFLSPAIFTQTIGLTYDPIDFFTQRLGVASKETLVLIPRFRTLYGVPDHTPIYFEIGFESRSQFDKEIFENVRLKSSLGLFAAFNKADVPDLLWENLVAMKVNSWLSVNLQVDTLYDRDISNAVQLKEVISLGILYAFI